MQGRGTQGKGAGRKQGEAPALNPLLCCDRAWDLSSDTGCPSPSLKKPRPGSGPEHPPCPPPSPGCLPLHILRAAHRGGDPEGRAHTMLTTSHRGSGWPVFLGALSSLVRLRIRITGGCEGTRDGSLSKCFRTVSPTPPPPHACSSSGNTPIRMHNTFLICVDIAEWVEGAILQRGNIMSDPGFLKAILTPSGRWATNRIDLNENWLWLCH